MKRSPFPRKDTRHPAGPEYNDYEQPAPGEFYRARSQIVTMWRKVTIDLSVAESNHIEEVTGDFIYCDMSSTGTLATVEFNNQMADEAGGFQANGGWWHRGPFTRLKLSWTAQPGRFVKLLYSTGLEVDAGLGLVQVTQQGNPYGAANSGNALIPAGGTVQIFSAAQNVNGAVLWNAQMLTGSLAANLLALMAKATAPTSSADGDAYLFASAAAGSFANGPLLPMPIRVPAGKGLFIFSFSLENTHAHLVEYSLL